KLFHTGEGGAIVCPDKQLSDKIFYHHNFGHRGEEEFWGLGVNAKISELNAAMGLSVMPYLDQIIARRKDVCDLYDNVLDRSRAKRLRLRDQTDWNFAYYPIIFASHEALLKAKDALNLQQIYPRRYFYPSLNKLPYLEYTKAAIAEDLSSRVLCLPLSAALE